MDFMVETSAVLKEWILGHTSAGVFLQGLVTGFVIFYFLNVLLYRGSTNKRPTPEPKSRPVAEDCKMVLVIRTDLQMGKGKVAAQCSHATLDAYKQALKQSQLTRDWLHHWESEGVAKITLKCQDEDEMLRLQKEARSVGLVAKSIVDAGRTQIAAGSRTVLAIGPGP
jgi:PTH2 family peptidyl-tRNA hydrolase